MIFIRRLMPEALQMEIPPNRGFHGSLARFYGPFNHERHCLKHTMITSMNEYNSEVYKSDRIWTGEYFSRPSMFLTRSWSNKCRKRKFIKFSDLITTTNVRERYGPSLAKVYRMARPSSVKAYRLVMHCFGRDTPNGIPSHNPISSLFLQHMVESGPAKVWHHARSMILGT